MDVVRWCALCEAPISPFHACEPGYGTRGRYEGFCVGREETLPHGLCEHPRFGPLREATCGTRCWGRRSAPHCLTRNTWLLLGASENFVGGAASCHDKHYACTTPLQPALITLAFPPALNARWRHGWAGRRRRAHARERPCTRARSALLAVAARLLASPERMCKSPQLAMGPIRVWPTQSQLGSGQPTLPIQRDHRASAKSKLGNGPPTGPN